MAQSVQLTRPQTTSVANPHPWQVLGVLCMAVFMLLLDTTVVNVAQVKIKDSLGASLTEMQWILDSYILAYAVLLLSFGRLGDLFGRKKLFILGMSIFTAASALCGASEWIGNQIGVSGVYVLIASRVLQGIGGAFMMPQSLSLLTVNFPPEKRGAAFGVWGSVVALGAIVGPILGGLIVTDYDWPWIFLINVPVGIVSIFLIMRIVPESTDPMARPGVDWTGVALSGASIFCLVFACIEGNRLGWTSPEIIGLFVLSAILLLLFIWWEHRVDDPIMKIELFRIRNFSVGNVLALIVAFGMLGIFFPLTLFLQQVLGFTPIRAGLTLTPMSVMILFVAPVSGRFTDRIGARWILFVGASLMTVGIFLTISQIDTDTTSRSLFLPLAVTGFGMGMTFAPMTAAAMRDVPPRIAGSASGILNTMRNIGQVLGIAVLGSVLQNRLGAHASDNLASLPIDASLRENLADLASQNQFSQIAQLVPAELAAQVTRAIDEAFVSAIHNTFTAGALACAAAAATALLIRNPSPRPVAVEPSMAERREAAVAD
jgi:EmrB/QacA subfamily drug resistance transporter